jgi:hypothetical protein
VFAYESEDWMIRKAKDKRLSLSEMKFMKTAGYTLTNSMKQIPSSEVGSMLS